MTAKRTNLGASITHRLLNRAKAAGEHHETLLTTFCLERFLYRLGRSGARDRFVLKGAMLLRLWADQPYRATRDLDLLRKGDGSSEAIRRDVETICTVSVEPDAVEFDADSVRLDVIRAEDESAGTRVILPARCDAARLRLQIDLGVGDAVWPAPQRSVYPGLLDFPSPEVLAYPPEAVVAEKLEALVVLGARNSRIKDFFDLHYLAGRFEFDRATLAESVRRTFAKRGTPPPAEVPIGLTPKYWENASRPIQMQAFARRAHLKLADGSGRELAPMLEAFLLPVLDDMRGGHKSAGTWPPGGPWKLDDSARDEAP